jgi:hypothetical protein
MSTQVESSFGVDAEENPVSVAVLLEAPLGNLAREPLRYVKSFKSIRELSSPQSIDLKATDLAPGDRVTVLAFNRAPGSTTGPGQLVEGCHVGSLFNASNFETAYTLKSGANDLNAAGFKVNLDRIYYEHNGTIQFKLDGSTQLRSGDTITVVAYATGSGGDVNILTLGSQLSSIDYSKVISFGKFAYNGVGTINIPILPALGPALVDSATRKISNVIIAGFRDDNGNGNFENSEPAAFYTESGSLGPVLKVISLTSNNLTGSLIFNGTANRIGDVLQSWPFGAAN